MLRVLQYLHEDLEFHLSNATLKDLVFFLLLNYKTPRM